MPSKEDVQAKREKIYSQVRNIKPTKRQIPARALALDVVDGEREASLREIYGVIDEQTPISVVLTLKDAYATQRAREGTPITDEELGEVETVFGGPRKSLIAYLRARDVMVPRKPYAQKPSRRDRNPNRKVRKRPGEHLSITEINQALDDFLENAGAKKFYFNSYDGPS